MTSTTVSSFSGRSALVTGAGSGIGRAAALRLARSGARVALLGRTEDELQDTAADVQAAGATALILKADVAQPDQLQAAFATLAAQWRELHVVVANAGINGTWAPIEELEVEDWDRTLNINLRGTFLTVKHAVPLMKTHGGAVVIVSSVNGTRMFSNAGASAYATSKAGQVAFARMMALELARSRIRVNAVCPGAIRTSINDNTQKVDTADLRPPVEYPEGKVPLTRGRPGSAEQVAELIHFLASDAADHITGAEVFIDGAESLLEG